MTDDRRFYVLGKGRLTFPDFPQIDEINLARPRERNPWTGKFDMSACAKASILFLLGRPYIPTMVGHDPQKLLPSPQHFGRDPETFGTQVVMRMAHSLGLTYEEMQADYAAELIEHPPTRWKKAVIVIGDDATDVHAQISAALAMPNVLGIDIDIHPSSGYLPPDLFLPRWNESGADPLADIARWRKQFDMVERFENVRPNHQMQMYALGVMLDTPLKPVADKPQKGYLKHDPTKTHNRRRRRK